MGKKIIVSIFVVITLFMSLTINVFAMTEQQYIQQQMSILQSRIDSMYANAKNMTEEEKQTHKNKALDLAEIYAQTCAKYYVNRN